MRSAIGLALAAGMLLGAPAMALGTDAGGDVEVLNEETIWRFHAVYRPPKGKAVRASAIMPRRWVRWGDELCGPLPPGDWMKPDFDDSGWPRRRGPILGVYGGARRAGVALLCVRGRFGVTDPARAKGLKLELTYRGGAVAYVNGKEVARGHLRRGNVEPLTLAEDYPREAFLTPDGKKLLPSLGRREPPAKLKDRYNARIRKLTASVPSRVLRKGTNLLAVELHRTGIPTEVRRVRRFQETWHTAGLVRVKLTARAGSAVAPNVKAPGGVQVWNASPLLRVGVDADYGDPFEPLGPIELLAPRNGIASGQVVVTAKAIIPALSVMPVPVEINRLSGKISDLKSPEGAAISARAIRVRYAKPFGDRGFLALLDRPIDAAKIQAIWLTAKVPANARPGNYTGELTITGLTQPVRVPVEVTVYGWKLGDPKDWKTWVNLLQSPESVAGYYKVPLWSRRHFALMERSFELMGRCGNDILGISAVRRNVFGDDPVLVFRKQGNGYAPELKFLERYLELYNRRAGKPKFLVLHVWSYGMYQRGAGRDGGDKEWRATTIPAVELQGEKLAPVELPIYGEPGTEALWQQAMDGLRKIVTKLGWPEQCILLGTAGDCWPHARTIHLFKKVAPYARWRAITHGSGVPRWGKTDEERTQPNGMVVGYLELVRRITNRRPRVENHPTCCNARDCTRTDPFQYRSLPVLNTMSAGFDGFCWKGLDYWTYTTPQGTQRSALNAYVRFGNIVGSTPRTIAAPGPYGAVATVQYEILREGIQDAEAMLFIRETLNNKDLRGRLGGDLAKRCETVIEDMLCMLETGARFSPQGGGDVRRHVMRLYATATEVAAAIGAGP